MASIYNPPLALTIVSSISIGVAALFSLWILIDIIIRRGWRSMMGVMIPVYIINASYIWPVTMWVYLNYGRPADPRAGGDQQHHHHHEEHAHEEKERDEATPDQHSSHTMHEDLDRHHHHEGHTHEEKEGGEGMPHQHSSHKMHEDSDHHQMSSSSSTPPNHGVSEKDHSHHHSSETPMFATVTVAVCHCGAGCVLGDIVGEWIVYGTGAEINGEMLWVEYLVDFGFALFFGIFFQYFSIAPMSGEWGPKTLVRAAKADFLSLAFFQIGLFGWMAIFQIAIFNHKLQVNTVTYWWMMQIGMFLGHWTAMPINWVLIKNGIKEPCA